MHFEILVEDQSGKIFLDLIIPQLIGKEHTFHVHAYKGIGRIPKNLHGRNNPADRLLLQNLPKILRGYGNTFKNDPENYRRVVLVVCDLDRNAFTCSGKNSLRFFMLAIRNRKPFSASLSKKWRRGCWVMFRPSKKPIRALKTLF